MFSKVIRTLYFYLIALITLCMIACGSVATIINISNVIIPEKNTYLTVESQKREKNQNIKNIIYSLSVVGVAVPIYLYHWAEIEKNRKGLETKKEESKEV